MNFVSLDFTILGPVPRQGVFLIKISDMSHRPSLLIAPSHFRPFVPSISFVPVFQGVRCLIIGILSLLLSLPLIAQTQGKVVAVADGDTFTMLTGEKKQIKVRLYGIDCPERKQAFGQVAKDFTADAVFGKEVKLSKEGKDRYGRTVAIVELEDGRILNEMLLQAGLAWHYKRYDKNPDWAQMETRARRKRLGLWKDKYPIAPWDFR